MKLKQKREHACKHIPFLNPIYPTKGKKGYDEIYYT